MRLAQRHRVSLIEQLAHWLRVSSALRLALSTRVSQRKRLAHAIRVSRCSTTHTRHAGITLGRGSHYWLGSHLNRDSLHLSRVSSGLRLALNARAHHAVQARTSASGLTGSPGSRKQGRVSRRSGSCSGFGSHPTNATHTVSSGITIRSIRTTINGSRRESGSRENLGFHGLLGSCIKVRTSLSGLANLTTRTSTSGLALGSRLVQGVRVSPGRATHTDGSGLAVRSVRASSPGQEKRISPW